jgi:hypothetical protein
MPDEMGRTAWSSTLSSGDSATVAICRPTGFVGASPRLLDTECRTVEQMRFVNALCRFVEVVERNGTNLTTA